MNHMTTQQTVDAFFAAFGAGDMETVKSLFSDTIEFTVHGSPITPWAGRRTRRDELDAFFDAFAALGPAKEYTILHTLVDADHAVLLGRNSFPVLPTGKTFTNEFALHMTVREGKITGYQMYEDSYAIHEAFTSGS